jgi:hypothetical protein
MVEPVGRGNRLQFEVNGDCMPLAGSDLEPVRADLKPLLIVCFHDPKQSYPVELQPFLSAPGQQAFDIRLSLGIQIQPDRLRFMTEDKAEELSIRHPSFFHCRLQGYSYSSFPRFNGDYPLWGRKTIRDLPNSKWALK